RRCGLCRRPVRCRSACLSLSYSARRRVGGVGFVVRCCVGTVSRLAEDPHNRDNQDRDQGLTHETPALHGLDLVAIHGHLRTLGQAYPLRHLIHSPSVIECSARNRSSAVEIAMSSLSECSISIISSANCTTSSVEIRTAATPSGLLRKNTNVPESSSSFKICTSPSPCTPIRAMASKRIVFPKVQVGLPGPRKSRTTARGSSLLYRRTPGALNVFGSRVLVIRVFTSCSWIMNPPIPCSE